MSANDNSQRLLSLEETARRLGISLRSLRLIISGAELRTVRPTPGRVLVAEEDLNSYITSLRQPGGAG